MIRIPAVFAATALLSAALASPLSAEEKSMDRTVTVSASGTVSAVPDQASVSTGVTSEAKTAKDALAANTAAMKQMISDLKLKGVEDKDVQTNQFGVDPVYVYQKEGQTPTVTGYRVTNMIGVRVRNLDRLGEVLDQLITSGANQINGLSFDVSKAESMKDDARKAAMSNAMRRAKLLAVAAGADLGEVMQISEDIAIHGPQPVVFAQRSAMPAQDVPVERGVQQLETRVTVTWKLK
jgi:uncharacterized protein YggE